MSRPIAFYPQIARELGDDIHAAIFFQQLCYWSDKGRRVDGFIYKSKEDIESETTLSREQQDRIRKKLVEKNWIEVKKLHSPSGAPTLHYRCLRSIKVSSEPISVKPTNGNKVPLVGNPLILDKCETHQCHISESTSENTLPGMLPVDDKKAPVRKEESPPSKKEKPAHVILAEKWKSEYEHQFKEPYELKKRDYVAAAELISKTDFKVLQVSRAAWKRAAEDSRAFNCQLASTLYGLSGKWPLIIAELSRPIFRFGNSRAEEQCNAKHLKDGDEW